MRLLKLRFLGQHWTSIKEAYLQHASATGYVFIKADESFDAVERPRFIQRQFNKEEFLLIKEISSSYNAANKEDWLYYEIFWEHDHSIWRLKELCNEELS